MPSLKTLPVRPLQVPTTMKSAAFDHFGPPDVLNLHTLPVPEVGPHDVLIAVFDAGVGYWDVKIRDGSWAEGRMSFPCVLGTDGSGIVVAKGSRVRRLQIGDRVWASQYMNPKGGFYAEYVAIDADNAARIPESLDMLHAAVGCVTGLTALQGIDDHLEVSKGETVLIFGASGAVGTLAVQFAKRRRAKVIGAASGRDGAMLVKRLGADVAVDAKAGDPAATLRQMAPDGIDAVLALVGGESLEHCLDLVKRGGRVAYPNGVEPEPKRRRNFHLEAYDGLSGPREFARLERAVEEVQLRVPVAKAYPLAQAAEAHARIEAGHVLGRIALRVRRGH